MQENDSKYNLKTLRIVHHFYPCLGYPLCSCQNGELCCTLLLWPLQDIRAVTECLPHTQP